MNNANSPAMPTNFTWVDDHEKHHEMNSGLTKLEHFAGLAIPPMEMIIEAMTAHSSPFNLDDYIVCAVSYKIKEAKALLKQLEGESNE